MCQPVKSLLLLFFILSYFSSYNTSAQTETKYSESMLEINEYLLANEFSEALPILKKLVDEGYQNGNVNYKLGLCYLNSFKERLKAIAYLKDAVTDISETYSADNENETHAPLRTLMILGDAYRFENKFKEAENAYHNYLNRVISNPIERELATKRLEECHIAQVLIKNPVQAKFINLGKTINSGLSDFDGCLSGNGKVLVFSRRLKFYDAIFYCTRTSAGWSEPENITTQIGSDGEFHPTGLSYDGSRMLLMSFTHLNGYDLYESTRISEKWNKVHTLNTLNSPYHDIDAVFAPDGKSVFFSSNRSNGIGGYDLYTSTISEDGKYSVPYNIGSPINTIWDEKTPSLFNNGNSIIFSSERNPGMGGFDLFYSNKNTDNSWGYVYNIGYPINTTDNDHGFQLVSSGKEGIISRHDNEGFTDIDIFQVQVGNFSKFRLIPLHGEVIVNGKANYSSKGSSFFLIDETLNDTLSEITEIDSGKFNLDIYPGKFQLVMSNVNQKSMSQSFTVPSDLEKPDFNLVSTFSFEPETKVGTVIAEKQIIDTIEIVDIYFDFNKADISIKEQKKLSELTTLLKKYRLNKIELLGYSDSKGLTDYNLKLSLKRANRVLNFFTENGISGKIIYAKGMGSTNFASKNSKADGTDNPKGRAFNRRVEIMFIPTDSNLIIQKKNIVPKELRP